MQLEVSHHINPAYSSVKYEHLTVTLLSEKIQTVIYRNIPKSDNKEKLSSDNHTHNAVPYQNTNT